MLQSKDKKNRLLFYLTLLILLSTINTNYSINENQPVTVIKKIKVNGLSNLNNFL